MSRIAIEIIGGIGLFLLGTFVGILLICICQANGEAERNLEEKNNERN